MDTEQPATNLITNQTGTRQANGMKRFEVSADWLADHLREELRIANANLLSARRETAERDRELQQAQEQLDHFRRVTDYARCESGSGPGDLQGYIEQLWADRGDAASELSEAREELARLKLVEENVADYAKRFFRLFDQYRGAWLREIGGVIRPKSWEIDGFVLRTRDIYEKAQLVDRMKQIMVKQVEAKCTAMELFDAVFEMLAHDKHDQIPTN